MKKPTKGDKNARSVTFAATLRKFWQSQLEYKPELARR